MNTGLQPHVADNRRLLDGLRQALDMHYARLLETARREWELHFAGKDSSDACSSVRVTPGDSQAAPALHRNYSEAGPIASEQQRRPSLV